MNGSARPLVLVCDDEVGPRLSMQMMLDHTCDVVVTATRADAITAVRQRRFDAAIIDWTLPEPGQLFHPGTNHENGGHVVAQLHDADPALAVIVWTAHGENVKEQAGQLGAYSILAKPVSLELAEAEVANAVAATRNRRRSASNDEKRELDDEQPRPVEF